jgi:hypothetical protein
MTHSFREEKSELSLERYSMAEGVIYHGRKATECVQVECGRMGLRSRV